MREVGGYRLVRQIGFGGMSTVYEAVNGAGDHVALKLLHPSLAVDEEARERLRREVAVLRRVRSPYVAEVIDAEFDAVEPFIVTELVPGLTLEADVQQNGVYTEEDLVRLGEQLGAALAAVHDMGVLHRDLKPSNVMIVGVGSDGVAICSAGVSSGSGVGCTAGVSGNADAREDAWQGAAESVVDAGRPVLIDFGIAQAQGEARLTQQGSLALTPGYCDPRVLRGADPDQAADWWALAAVLAYAATGVPPFGEGSAPVVIQRVLRGEPDLPDLDPVVAQAFRAALAGDSLARLSYWQLLAAIREPATWIQPLPEIASEDTVMLNGADAPAIAEERTLVIDGVDTPESSAMVGVFDPPESSAPPPNLEVLALTHPEQLPRWAREPKKCRSLLLVIWLAMVAFGARWPAWMLVGVAVAVYLLDIVGTSAQFVRRRQLRRGEPRAGDGAIATLRLPLTVLTALARSMGTILGVALIALGVGWVAVQVVNRYGSALAAPQVAAVVVALVTAALWFSPLSKQARAGVRYVTGGKSPSRLPRLIWLLVALAALAAGVVMVSQTSVNEVSWLPFSDSFNLLE